MRILLVEDDRRTVDFVSKALTAEGYDVDDVADGHEALRMLERTPYDGVVLDIMLTGRDGLGVLRQMRSKGNSTPVLILSARNEVAEKVEGLDAGAEDYVAKPFALVELIARVRSLLRRSGNVRSGLLRVADLTLDSTSRTAERRGRRIELTNREYRLLEFLMRSEGNVCSRILILEAVWEYDFDPGTNIVDVFTAKRRELESLHRERDHLVPDQNTWIEHQLDEVARLAKIVDSLILLTKADAGLRVLEREEVDFRALVLEAFEHAAVLAESRAISVTMGEVAPVRLIGDRHRLRQLLLILIDNAVKYNRPGGSIHLSSSAAEGAVELHIINEGGSLTEELRHRAFDRFFRGDNAIGKVAGCGVGLTIARWIALAHEGSIELRSESPGSTTACVRLPIICSPVPAPSRAGSRQFVQLDEGLARPAVGPRDLDGVAPRGQGKGEGRIP